MGNRTIPVPQQEVFEVPFTVAIEFSIKMHVVDYNQHGLYTGCHLEGMTLLDGLAKTLDDSNRPFTT